MVRVAHQKPTKQAAASKGLRASKIAKQQQKKHKVVLQSTSDDKKQSHNVLSFRAEPPEGYTFIPAGNPEFTAALKTFAKKANREIFAVTTTPHASRHELSREVHRVGFHFPTDIVNDVCSFYGVNVTSGGRLVNEKDDDQLFMRVYQKGQLVLNEEVRDQVTINTEAKQIIKDLFPHIPDNDLFQIIKTAFQLGDGKVGTADEIPLVRRAQLSVVAHIRHTYTNYDKLLRQVPYSEARHRVENETLKKLVEWRGDNEDDQAMDDTLREVVVISDEEESDEYEEGQLLEHNDLQVQPVAQHVRGQQRVGGRGVSPIEVHSDDEPPRGYRYVPQIVRRVPLRDQPTAAASRQQSRFSVWDRLRQEYRSENVVQQPTRVVERVVLDDPQASHIQPAYVLREPLHDPEHPVRRQMEPPARAVQQPTFSSYIRTADGRVFEKIVTNTDSIHGSLPPRRIYTPPSAELNRHYINSRPASPPTHGPVSLSTRRTASFAESDGTVLPSIEGPSTVYSSPATQRNPFDEFRQPNMKRISDGYQYDPRQSLADLPNGIDQAFKRRRHEEIPSPANVGHQSRRIDDDRAIHTTDHRYTAYESPQRRVIDVTASSHNSSPQIIQYSAPDRHRQDLDKYTGNLTQSSRLTGVTRPVHLTDARDTHLQSASSVSNRSDMPRRVYGYDNQSHQYSTPTRPVAGPDRQGIHVLYEELPGQEPYTRFMHRPQDDTQGYRYVQQGSQTSFASGTIPQQYTPQPPLEGVRRRDHDPSHISYLPDYSRVYESSQIPVDVTDYPRSKIHQAPVVEYRDNTQLRSTYVQN